MAADDFKFVLHNAKKPWLFDLNCAPSEELGGDALSVFY